MGAPGGPLSSMSCQSGNGRWREGDCIHMDILEFKFQIHIMMIKKCIDWLTSSSPWKFESNSLNCLQVFIRNIVGKQLNLFISLGVKARPNNDILFD